MDQLQMCTFHWTIPRKNIHFIHRKPIISKIAQDFIKFNSYTPAKLKIMQTNLKRIPLLKTTTGCEHVLLMLTLLNDKMVLNKFFLFNRDRIYYSSFYRNEISLWHQLMPGRIRCIFAILFILLQSAFFVYVLFL